MIQNDSATPTPWKLERALLRHAAAQYLSDPVNHPPTDPRDQGGTFSEWSVGFLSQAESALRSVAAERGLI